MKIQEVVEEPVGKPKGYLRSRYNAVRHKMTAKTAVLSGESQEHFDSLLSNVRDRINSDDDAVAAQFVDQIVFNLWKIRRCREADRLFVEKHTSLTNGNKRDIDWTSVFKSGVMNNLTRYETTALNQVKKLLDMLTTYRNFQAVEVIDADVSDG